VTTKSLPLAPCDRSIPWSSAVRSGWPLRPLKTVVGINRVVLPETTPPDRPVEYVDIGSVDAFGRISDVALLTFEEAPSRARRVPRAGDTIVSTVRTYLKAVAFIDNPNPALVCSTGFAVLTPGRALFPKFLFYWVLSNQFVDEVCARSVGVSYPALNPSEVGQLPVAAPPLQEQRAISDFLDRKTAAIDALIVKKERHVILLREKRQAIVSQAVTRGLEPRTPEKDSGEQWLGPVPQHWKVARAKFHIRLVTSGSRGWGEYLSERGPLFLQSGNLGDDLSLDLREVQRVQLPSRAEGVRTLVRRGDVLVCITGAYTGNVAVVQQDLGEAYVNQHIALIRVDPVHIDPMFLGHYLASPFGAYQCAQAQYGGTKQGLGLDDVKNVVVPLPPLQEQRAITAALAPTSAALGRAVSAMTESIERLREYRQALITSAVTGQLDVAAQPQEAA